jgi:shikimate kinase
VVGDDLVRRAAAALGPRNLVLVGFMGTGKSTLGRRAAAALGRPFWDTDEEVERLAGCPVAEVFARWGEARFRAWEAEVVRRLAPPGARVLATGGGVLGDPGNAEALLQGGWLVALTARPEVVLERVGGAHAGRTRPLLAAADPLGRIRSLLAAREAWYRQAHATLDTSDLGVEEAVAALLQLAAEAGR